MRWLIDGMNVIGTRPDAWWKDRHAAMVRLVDLLERWAAYDGEDVTVVAPPNPLRGLSGGDGEYIKAVIDQIDGPVLLVGHSYGGSVITAAGTADNVVGLVYISGFARTGART